MRRALLLLVLLAAPLASAQPSGAIDATITLAPDAPPALDAPPGLVRVNGSTPGERYLLDLALTREYTTFEVRASGFALERPRQLVPSLLVAEDRYPLFHPFPNAEIWTADGPANVFHVSGSGDALVLRLGVAGPRNVTLALEVDRAPPSYTLGERQDLTHIGFYQETRTDELALADLQVRRVGARDWVQNPTPEYHVLQRFPVQGLDPETEYETRVVFVDWAGNEVVSPVERFTTPPAPSVPAPSVRIVSPAPNATVAPGAVVVRATIEENVSRVAPQGVRLFFDKREVPAEQLRFESGDVVYVPTTTLLPGKHSVSVEVTNEAGGRGEARWTFEVEGARAQTPMPALGALVACALLAALARDMSLRRRQ